MSILSDFVILSFKEISACSCAIFTDPTQRGPYTVTILSREKCMHMMRYSVISTVHIFLSFYNRKVRHRSRGMQQSRH